MTVKELKQILSGIDDDYKIFMSDEESKSSTISAIHIDIPFKQVELRTWINLSN